VHLQAAFLFSQKKGINRKGSFQIQYFNNDAKEKNGNHQQWNSKL
jgi:hypothetical protein